MINTDLKDIKNVYIGNNTNAFKVYIGDTLVHVPWVPSYVEIGGVKWATCNIGAEKPEEIGWYFQFANTDGYPENKIGTKSFDPRHCSGVYVDNYSGSVKSSIYYRGCYTLAGPPVVQKDSDAVVRNWKKYGSKWRLPTVYDYNMLLKYVDTQWVENYNDTGVNGIVCIDKTDSSKVLFFPAGGYVNYTTLYDKNTLVDYWTATANLSYDERFVIAHSMKGSSSSSFKDYDGETKYYGLPIRGIFDDAIAPEYVEIGGTKWSTRNVGASEPWDTGLYFQWGDTQGYTQSQIGSETGKKYFGWSDYKWGNPDDSGITKYNSTDGKTVLDIEDDAVRAALGGNWRTPTKEEWTALMNNTNAVWTTNYRGSEKYGFVCYDKTDNSKSLFFPLVNLYKNGKLDAYNECIYMSSTIGNNINNANGTYIRLYSNKGFMQFDTDKERCMSFALRGVLDE